MTACWETPPVRFRPYARVGDRLAGEMQGGQGPYLGYPGWSWPPSSRRPSRPTTLARVRGFRWLAGRIVISPTHATRSGGRDAILFRHKSQDKSPEEYDAPMGEGGGLGGIGTEVLAWVGIVLVFVAVAAWRFVCDV